MWNLVLLAVGVVAFGLLVWALSGSGDEVSGADQGVGGDGDEEGADAGEDYEHLPEPVARALRAERWDEAVHLLENVAADEDDASRRAEMLRRAGDLCKEELDEADRAIEFYERATETYPERGMAMLGLLEIFEAREAWGDMAETERAYLEQLRDADVEPDSPLIIGAWKSLAVNYIRRLEKPAAGREALERLEELDPEDESIEQLRAELEKLENDAG